ncbi:2-dehydropantoate 2-reductase [Gaetbulibacter aquiaggeris]|uniref:2-dehydropantoate 2-reductase n=1 Tax=Gaetbulibacter aquiaggeris TaxID=1735373 RepID=A0ABW7MLG9_9FLAO
MNIVVIGTGGVGGYFGGKLAKAGFEVTFIARGKHLEAIKEKGLQVKSILGDFIVHAKATDNIGEIKNPDLVILGVKSWQVLGVAKELKSVITPRTMVLPLQNGADNANTLLSVLPKENVLAGLSKIVSKVESPGVINHFAFEPEIIFAEYNSEETERVKEVKAVFDKAGFKNSISKDIQLDIWRKFLFITMVSGIGAITRVTYKYLQQSDQIKEIIWKTGEEVVSVANAKGIPLKKQDIEFSMQAFINSVPNTTASMQRDMMEGKPSELENFNGYIVNQGKRLGIETPTNAFIYHCLLPQEMKARS